jgi:SAM-dependent methyltransferase
MRQFLKHHLPKDFRYSLLKVERMIKLLIKPSVLASIFSFDALKKSSSDNRFTTNIHDSFPITGENTKYTSFDRHYVYHTSWAARVIAEIARTSNDFVHTDISSSLYFCGLVSAFVPVRFYDYRPADLQLEGLETRSGDLMKLPFPDQSIESISCLHTIEHVGLGRYGDKLDPAGDLKALAELRRVVQPGGHLILVVPVGKQKIEFNAHRIYNPANFVSYVTEMKDDNGNTVPTGFSLKEYAYIPETDREGPLKRNADIANGANDRYACGCFWFVRDAS